MKMARLALILVLILFVTVPAFQNGDDLAPYEGKIIESITIMRRDIFGSNGNGDLPFYFRWANKIHIKTRKSVIEGELLFKIGQPLIPHKITESARNIRLRKFIGEVLITAAPNGDDGVDITVVTIDNWTTKAALFLEKGGGEYLFGASLAEDNLLGYGRMVQLSGSISEDNDGYSLYFGDDRMGRTRWAGSFLYSDFTLSEAIVLSLVRPQYSLDIPFGISARFTRIDGVIRLYSEGDEFFRYNRILNDISISSIYSIGHEKRVNFYGLYNFEDFDNSPYYDRQTWNWNNYFIPEDETRSYPSLGIGASVIEYDLERYLDEAGTPEDLTLGGSTALIMGRSVPELGADYIGTSFTAKAGFLIRPFKNIFIGGGNRVAWWYSGGRELISNKSTALFYLKTTGTQVLALRALTNFAWRQRSGYQVLLGGRNGLRGYSSYRFEGHKLALGNIEYRFFTPWEILTARPGGVLFFDIGEVWSEGEKIGFDNMKSNIGIGLRLGLTKSSTARVLRLDFAKPLTENDYYISFGTGILFNLRSIIGRD